MRYYYRNFVDEKIRWTAGKFIRWEQGGIIGAWGAVFALKTSSMWIPWYCITSETLNVLPRCPDRKVFNIGDTVQVVVREIRFSDTFTVQRGKRGNVIEVHENEVRIAFEDGDIFSLGLNVIGEG